jgi:AcrR family transcriptional regulator
MPKISKERLLARERGIVQAAVRCLQRNGLQNTGMRDLFRAANLSPGAVYRYFPSKDELVAAVAAAGPSLGEAALDATSATEEPRERLGRMLAAAAAGPPPARLQCELEAAALTSPRVAAALTERRLATRRALAEALGRPSGPDDESIELALILCDALARRRLLEPEADLRPQVAAAERLLTRAIEE